MNRKPISKKLRFEVFKRDFFTCTYCGNKPPKIVLEVDHLLPVSRGGKNNIDNLVCSCFDCNRGKSNTELSSVPPSLEIKNTQTEEKLKQYKEYIKYLDALEKSKRQEINYVENVYCDAYPEYCFADKFKMSVRRFIDLLGIEETVEAMEIACCRKGMNATTTITYFCGICWTKIREAKNG